MELADVVDETVVGTGGLLGLVVASLVRARRWRSDAYKAVVEQSSDSGSMK